MAHLNRILWLLCRLNGRAVAGDRAGAAGLVLFFLSSALTLPFLAGGAFLAVLGQSAERARELTHLLLSGVYASWMVLPLLGYRFSEALDPTRLLAYPVAPWTFVAAAVLGGLLDVSAILLLPVVVGVALAHGGGVWGVLPATFLAFLLVLNTIVTSRFAALVLRHLVAGRRLMDVLVVVVPVGLLLILWGGQILVGAAEAGLLAVDSPLDIPLSRFTSFFPPGLAAEALTALRRGDDPSALYWTSVLVMVTLIVGTAGTLVATRMVTGAYPGGRPSAAPRRPRSWRPSLYPLLRRVMPDQGVAALVVKDLALFLREPQYRLVVVLYLVMFSILVAGAAFVPGEPGLLHFVALMVVSSAVFFGGFWFNVLAVERRGLAVMMAAPVDGLGLLVAKSLALMIMVAPCVGLVMTAQVLLLGTPPVVVLVEALATCLLTLTLAGVGNVVSVLCPVALPEGGVAQRRPPGFGRIMALSILTSLALSSALLLAVPAASVAGLAAMAGPVFLAALLPAVLLYGVGVWALFTVLAGRLLERRRERLVAEVVE